ncbi:MAG: AAA family ATPase [Pseudomonadota bacterium]
MDRYLKKYIKNDLKEKMVFVGGARQVGKTTMALSVLNAKNEKHPAYLNWDILDNKRKIKNAQIPKEENLIVFDEIHKYKDWRNLIKGIYDEYKSEKQFLITGSARLDYYRRGGDSLLGRYHYYRLHPLSLLEINKKPNKNDLSLLLEYGGFPEPFLKANKRSWKRWQLERNTRVIQDDLVNLEKVREISQLSLLSSILHEKVGSILSLNSLREDLNVAFETVDTWISILENLYYCYRISPFGINKLRCAKKEKKLYLWDWSMVQDQGSRFENLVASHLLKYCHFIEDTQGDKMELNFIRDADKREIDFIVLKNSKPCFAVETKHSAKSISKHIAYFSKRSKIPQFYQVHLGDDDYEKKELRTHVIPFHKFSEILV